MIGSSNRIFGLDVLRGFAAVAVAVYHCIALLSLHAWDDLPAFTKYLYIAVPLFFAISAFSLCVGYDGRLEGAAAIRRFYTRRFLRIAPLFYLMMVLSVARRAYVGWGEPTVPDVFLNLTFLFPFVPGKHESLVPAGWSLGIEMLFYILFPVVLVFVSSLKRAFVAMVLATAVSFISSYWLFVMDWSPTFFWMALPVQFAFFIGGMLLYTAYRRIAGASVELQTGLAVAILGATIVGLYLGGAFGIFEYRYNGWAVGSSIVGFALLPLVLGFALYPVPFLVNRATIYLGKVSYGVYLIHPFIIRIVGEPLQQALSAAGWNAWQASPVIIFVVLIVTILLAGLSFRWLEAPFMALASRRRKADLVREVTDASPAQ
ncbi:peptidoglycan/LPS O-acetylase OafA/YrhL [Aminobacter aminovorans]|uniref:O-acetyltransferase OatA n=1 Tax=Aminobacter aminovorans TaxID=83263 RepID=A0A380WM72_AMIAI|nr:acyltransferase [Aminobacter aminovorans]TCS28166.1 peptidoglycan/LPS O-acetylase OafA/YrhL [Aminobacter aminovorans]SUU89422.1 O-acetyltransferase OatA [Aminobacter aminovorans]